MAESVLQVFEEWSRQAVCPSATLTTAEPNNSPNNLFPSYHLFP